MCLINDFVNLQWSRQNTWVHWGALPLLRWIYQLILNIYMIQKVKHNVQKCYARLFATKMPHNCMNTIQFDDYFFDTKLIKTELLHDKNIKMKTLPTKNGKIRFQSRQSVFSTTSHSSVTQKILILSHCSFALYQKARLLLYEVGIYPSWRDAC